MYSNAYVWSRVLAYLEQHSPAVAVASFFDDAEVAELNEEKLVLYSPSPFRKDVILNRYTNLIKDAMRELFQTEIELVVLDEDEFPQYSLGSKRRAFVEFNSQYTFDTFVVGSSNKHAFSAAEAVAEERTARRICSMPSPTASSRSTPIITSFISRATNSRTNSLRPSEAEKTLNSAINIAMPTSF